MQLKLFLLGLGLVIAGLLIAFVEFVYPEIFFGWFGLGLVGPIVWGFFILLILIGSVIYVKRVRPRKLARLKQLEESGGMWAQRIMGLMELRALFVTYSQTGLPIFTYDFAGGEMPSTLLAGFIAAVNSFYSELSGEIDRESQLRDIHYKDLHLSLREGTHIVSVLILDSSPSEEITESLASFTTQFETRFASEQL